MMEGYLNFYYIHQTKPLPYMSLFCTILKRFPKEIFLICLLPWLEGKLPVLVALELITWHSPELLQHQTQQL